MTKVLERNVVKVREREREWRNAAFFLFLCKRKVNFLFTPPLQISVDTNHTLFNNVLCSTIWRWFCPTSVCFWNLSTLLYFWEQLWILCRTLTLFLIFVFFLEALNSLVFRNIQQLQQHKTFVIPSTSWPSAKIAQKK